MDLKISATVHLLHLEHLIKEEKLADKIQACLKRADIAAKKGDISSCSEEYLRISNLEHKLKELINAERI